MSRTVGLELRIQSVTADIANSLGMKQAGGVIVDEPEAGSPAALVGIKSGDVITSLNGVPVKIGAGFCPDDWNDGARQFGHAYDLAQR